MNSEQPEVTRSPIMMAALQYIHGKCEGVENDPQAYYSLPCLMS